MPKSLDANLILEKNKIQSDSPWLLFLEITLLTPNNPNEVNPLKLYFVRNPENITYSGQEYIAFPFTVEPYKSTNKGEIPIVEIKVSNITQYIQKYLEYYQGGVGSNCKITVVNRANLDASYTELEIEYDVISCEANEDFIIFRVGAPNPLTQRFPLYRYIASHCRWTFRDAECGYTETTFANCERTMEDCRERERIEWFGGFPGLRNDTIKIA